MTLFQRALGIVIFVVILNTMAAAFGSALPTASAPDVTAINTKLNKYNDVNYEAISTQSSGFAVDVYRAFQFMGHIGDMFFGGQTIANLFGLQGSLADTVALWINTIEGAIYMITLFLFFSGRGSA